MNPCSCYFFHVQETIHLVATSSETPRSSFFGMLSGVCWWNAIWCWMIGLCKTWGQWNKMHETRLHPKTEYKKPLFFPLNYEFMRKKTVELLLFCGVSLLALKYYLFPQVDLRDVRKKKGILPVLDNAVCFTTGLECNHFNNHPPGSHQYWSV